jgi:hypothetical protein
MHPADVVWLLARFERAKKTGHIRWVHTRKLS